MVVIFVGFFWIIGSWLGPTPAIATKTLICHKFMFSSIVSTDGWHS